MEEEADADCFKGMGIRLGQSDFVDLSHLGHTSNPEYEELKNDKIMESLRDRTIKIDLEPLKDLDESKP